MTPSPVQGPAVGVGGPGCVFQGLDRNLIGYLLCRPGACVEG